VIRSKKILNFKVDATSAIPAYEQIKRAIKLAIISGYLEEGDQLMSLREIALKLTVNPNTVIKVYAQLETEGFIHSKPGAGYYVKLDHARILPRRQNLFQEITQEYISKALQLGYSGDDMSKEISNLTGKNMLIPGRKDKADD
jgi:GntR family transcriptional regulator